MTTVDELIAWLLCFQPTDQVAIDDGGLSLRILGTEAYYEVGGMPEIGDEKPTKCQPKE